MTHDKDTQSLHAYFTHAPSFVIWTVMILNCFSCHYHVIFTELRRNRSIREFRLRRRATTPENGDIMIDKMRITNSVTREADALEVCQMQCEISRLKVLMTTWTHTTLNLSFSMLTSTELLPVTQKCFFVNIDRMQGRSNNCKTNTFAQTFIFVGTFLFRSRHCCLNSLPTISARKHIVIGLLFPLIGREWGEAF